MRLVDSTVLVNALLVSVIGISVVAASLLLLVALTLGLRKIFAPEPEQVPVEAAEAPSSEESESVEASGVPDVVLAAVAVEHQRRSSGLGEKLARGSRSLRRVDVWLDSG